MLATTWGSEDVELRLRLVRRRLNSLALQHAAYFTFGLSLLAVSLVLLAALEADPWGFRLTFWGAVYATSAVFLFGGLHLRRRWMTLPDVARFADRLARRTLGEPPDRRQEYRADGFTLRIAEP